jgi:hypothetical protein
VEFLAYVFQTLDGERLKDICRGNHGLAISQVNDNLRRRYVTKSNSSKYSVNFRPSQAMTLCMLATMFVGTLALVGNAQTAPTKPVITVDNVIALAKAGAPDETIIMMIRRSNQSIDLEPNDVIRLKNAKVSDAVVKVMMNPKAEGRTDIATAAPASVPQQSEQSTGSAPAEPATQNSDAPKPKKSFFGGIRDGVKQGVTGKSSTKRAVDALGLRNTFPQYDPTKPISQQYPHIAVTVLKVPSGWTRSVVMTPGTVSLIHAQPNEYCFTLQAVVWSDARSSKTVGPFDWCSPNDLEVGLPLLYSDNPPPSMYSPLNSTGASRTNGPLPPISLFPNDRKTLDMLANESANNGGVRDLNNDRLSRMAIMFGNLRYSMGEIFGTNDYRMWVAEIKQ